MKSAHSPVFFDKQLHGIEYHVVKNEPRQTQQKNTESNNSVTLEGDILITHEKQIPIVIRIADCASVMIYDPVQKLIANIHAGWRGIAKRAVSHTIKTLIDRFHTNPADLITCISPMIGPCCCIFSNPKKELPRFMQSFVNEENHVDLWAAVECQLKESGVQKQKIENPRICTFCNPEDYPSYRRDGDVSGRFGTALMLR